MTLRAPMRCSALAEELGEPMIGTVDQRVRWLLIEDRSAWGSDAVNDVLGADLAREAKARKVRLLLVRRREGDPAADAVRRAILVDTATREMAIRGALGAERRRLVAIRTIRDPAELGIEEIADAPVPAFGAPTTAPIFLVCTNGKRDACCALRGRALMTSLADRHAESAWECTHLGGHRFAGNLRNGSFSQQASNLFGLDQGAIIGFEYRIGVMRDVQAAVYRTNFDKTFQFYGKYDAIRQHESMPASISGIVSIEGPNNFQERYAPAVGLVVSRKVADRLNGYAPDEHQYGFGIEKRVGGHAFSLTFTNSFGTTYGQIARGGTANALYLGFNLGRKFY